MRILCTGGYGALGRRVIRELSARGHRVAAFDRPTPRTRLLAARTRALAHTVWGDIRDPDAVREAVRGQAAIIHLAGILPPSSERSPHLAEQVNVGGTRNLLSALEESPSPRRPLFVFASSVAAYGPGQRSEGAPLRTADDPLTPVDAYSRSKATCELLVRESSVPWTILRIGVAVDPTAPAAALEVFRQLMATHPANRLETVDPSDLALAIANALETPAARGRILLIGGGPRCQIRQRDLLGAITDGLGLPALPDSAFGALPFYTDWLDTSESQRLLRYQRHDFETFRRELATLLRPARLLLGPVRRPTHRVLVALCRRLGKQPPEWGR